MSNKKQYGLDEETVKHMFRTLLNLNPEDDKIAFESFTDRMRKGFQNSRTANAC